MAGRSDLGKCHDGTCMHRAGTGGGQQGQTCTMGTSLAEWSLHACHATLQVNLGKASELLACSAL
jgi:hypothetical protein